MHKAGVLLRPFGHALERFDERQNRLGEDAHEGPFHRFDRVNRISHRLVELFGGPGHVPEGGIHGRKRVEEVGNVGGRQVLKRCAEKPDGCVCTLGRVFDPLQPGDEFIESAARGIATGKEFR